MRVALGVLSAVAFLAYPALVYIGLSELSVQSLGLLLLVLVVPLQVVRLWRQGKRQLLALLPLPLSVAALLVASVAIDDHRFILALPVLINIALLANFGLSLRAGRTPTIERFARLQVQDLSSAEVSYCRTVTWIWCGVFLVNAGIIAALAIGAPPSWWAAYAGGLAYVVIGTVFLIEYVVRKWRFRRYGKGPQDKIFRRLFPVTPQQADSR